MRTEQNILQKEGTAFRVRLPQNKETKPRLVHFLFFNFKKQNRTNGEPCLTTRGRLAQKYQLKRQTHSYPLKISLWDTKFEW